jgi:hypothetical protein
MNQQPDNQLLGVTSIVADEGLGKSSAGLTWPKPLFHMETDIGGFERAAWKVEKDNPGIRIYRAEPDEDIAKIDWDSYDIVTKPYPQPIQFDKMMGLTGDISTRKVLIPKKVVGMKELWQTFVIDFVFAVQLPTLRTVMVDSATMLWKIDHSGYLQELQEKQYLKFMNDKDNKGRPWDDNSYRERLTEKEYGTPNDRMRQVFHTVKAYRKNLVLTHYITDEYGAIVNKDGQTEQGRTGKKKMDGFSETAKMSDLIFWLSLKEQTSGGKTSRYVSAKITKCGISGMGLNAVGQEFVASYDHFMGLKRMMNGGS